MTLTEQIITVAVIVLATVLTRSLAFILFPAGKETPRYIQYLGGVLPNAIFAFLVIYCLRNVSFLSGSHGLPEIIAIAVITVLHFWQKNMLLSMAGGTASYMFLVQYIF